MYPSLNDKKFKRPKQVHIKIIIILFSIIAISFSTSHSFQWCLFAHPIRIITIDISNEKLSYSTYTKSNVLVIGEGCDRRFFKEKYVLTYPENIIKTETGKIFNDSFFMQQEIQKVLDKKLNFETSLSEIKKLQAFTDYNLCEFENICHKKYMSAKFCKDYCDIPFDTNQDLSIRNVATTKMAELLDIQDLIANSICANIKNKNGEIIEGILMDCAGGTESEELINKKVEIEPSMQKALSSLQIFDSICGQCDRFYKNYNIKLSSKGAAIGLCAFDNDWSFSLDTDMKKVRAWLPPIINRNGKINLPHIDKELAHRILDLDDSLIECTLTDYLDKKYIEATQNRVKQIQEAIRLTSQSYKNFLLEDSEWSYETMNEELTGDYHKIYTVKTEIGIASFGRTYLKLLYDFINKD